MSWYDYLWPNAKDQAVSLFNFVIGESYPVKELRKDLVNSMHNRKRWRSGFRLVMTTAMGIFGGLLPNYIRDDWGESLQNGILPCSESSTEHNFAVATITIYSIYIFSAASAKLSKELCRVISRAQYGETNTGLLFFEDDKTRVAQKYLQNTGKSLAEIEVQVKGIADVILPMLITRKRFLEIISLPHGGDPPHNSPRAKIKTLINRETLKNAWQAFLNGDCEPLGDLCDFIPMLLKWHQENVVKKMLLIAGRPDEADAVALTASPTLNSIVIDHQPQDEKIQIERKETAEPIGASASQVADSYSASSQPLQIQIEPRSLDGILHSFHNIQHKYSLHDIDSKTSAEPFGIQHTDSQRSIHGIHASLELLKANRPPKLTLPSF